jgi:hypothetical protein
MISVIFAVWLVSIWYATTVSSSHHTGWSINLTPRYFTGKFAFLFKSEFKLLNMSQSFLLQDSHSSQASVMSWGGSPIAWQPSTWPSPPPSGFWSPQGASFSRPPPLGQTSSTPPPQPGQGYWLPPMLKPWAPPLGGQALTPFGMPPLMTPQWPPTSPATVRHVFVR